MSEVRAGTFDILPGLAAAGLRHGFTTLAAGDLSDAALETEAGR